MIPVLIIGAGPTGSALGYGLAQRGIRVHLLDGGDMDYRAARANFGLVWQQGKGLGMTAYQELTAESVARWPEFCRQLQDISHIDLEYDGRGGLSFYMGEKGFAERKAALDRLAAESPCKASDVEMLDRAALNKLLPNVPLSDEVSGASFGHHDGHCNPLYLLKALHAAVLRLGGEITPRSPVQAIKRDGAGYRVICQNATYLAERVIIAAGLGSVELAKIAGLEAPLTPERGQIIVTEKVAPILPYAASAIRQTRNGSFMFGVTKEEVGFNTGTTGEGAKFLAKGALRVMPALRDLTVVRHWSALRIMTPDSYPIYAQSELMPGVSLAVCHSAVTLAAVHAERIASQLIDHAVADAFSSFHYRRFHVQKA